MCRALVMTLEMPVLKVFNAVMQAFEEARRNGLTGLLCSGEREV